MPSSRDFFMTSLISWTSPLKIRSEISGELRRTSTPRPALALAQRQQALRDHRLEFSDRSISSCWRRSREEVDDAVHRLVGVVGVQRAERQVAGLGEGDGVLHHLALCGSRRSGSTSGACRKVFLSAASQESVFHADLALRDHAVLVRVHELDRVLDGDDGPWLFSFRSRSSPRARSTCRSRWRRRRSPGRAWSSRPLSLSPAASGRRSSGMVVVTRAHHADSTICTKQLTRSGRCSPGRWEVALLLRPRTRQLRSIMKRGRDDQGGLVIFVGATGCGKSTSLRR